MEPKPISHITAGIILSVISIVLFFVYYYTGLTFEKSFWSWLPIIITVGLIIFFVLQFGKSRHDHVTFGNLFSYGFKTTAIFAIIMTIFMIVMVYLFPEYKEKMIEQITAQMEKQNNLPEEQKETAIKIMSKFFNVSVIGGALFMNLFFGAGASLLGAAFAKKRPVSPFENQV